MDKKVKPFLRWAGGKTWLVKRIESYIPVSFNNYHEPFLGGGSIFLNLKQNSRDNRKYFISDSNQDLIECYNTVRDELPSLIKELLKYQNTEEEYYLERDAEYFDPIKKAAQFIYLNRTSFNGLYRVNKNGKYNVPFGYKEYKELFDFDNMLHISNLLKTDVDILSGDFMNHLDSIKPGDLVFIDPPYTVAHGKNGFIKYNQQIFKWGDQVRLKEYIDNIIKKNAFFIMTNASHESIANLFSMNCSIEEIQRASLIGGKNAKRGKTNEFIFFNTRE